MLKNTSILLQKLLYGRETYMEKQASNRSLPIEAFYVVRKTSM